MKTRNIFSCNILLQYTYSDKVIKFQVERVIFYTLFLTT